MTTATLIPSGVAGLRVTRGRALLAVLVLWVLGWALWRGTDTLAIGGAQQTVFHHWLYDVRQSFDAARRDNALVDLVFGGTSAVLDAVVRGLQETFSIPAFPRPVPEVGYLGVLGIGAFVAYAAAGLRGAVTVLLGLLTFGLLGYWRESIDLLIVTGVSVVICVAVGIPLAILMARSRGVSAVVTPVLDVMQTLPSFAYLAPLVLLFGIGPASAVVATLIYALPPVVRVTTVALRSVSPVTLEAAASLGSTSGQQLFGVELPMAKRTIIVGINQTTMAALSMATISALINGPGLGQPVIQALQSLDIGQAFVSGLAIVVMAIMLDRSTTAASERSEKAARAHRSGRVRRRVVLVLLAVAAAAAVSVSRLYLWAAEFPEQPDLGRPLAAAVSAATTTVTDAIGPVTQALKDAVSYGLLNPLESLVADSPWWLTGAVLLAVSFILGGRRPTVTTAVCLAVVLGTGLWNEAMNTLTQTMVATVLVMAVALVVGVWTGRSRRADVVVRPFLDACQTIPPFVYLVPAFALLGVGRLTAIVAAVAYAAPVAIKLVSDGVRGVPAATVEAALSNGSTTWQMITKVQLPMARSALVLSANQGLLYVLAMVVVGGLVGGGGLGYLVVRGFSQEDLFGKGLAAGIAITALGVMLDRITQHTAARYGRATT